MNKKITGFDPILNEKLKRIAYKKGVSLNQLMKDVLEKYSLFGDKIFVNELPQTLQYLLKNYMEDSTKETKSKLDQIQNLLESIIEGD